jgi:hypothetical protein
MKIRPVVGSELFIRTDREADIAKLIVAYRNFANAPKTTFLVLFAKVNQTFII